MTFSKSTINAAKKIVKKSSGSITANKSNTQVCDLVEVGEWIGKNIHLTHADIQEIETFFEKQLGERLITYSTNSDSRMDMARPGLDEKSATGTVFQSLLNIASKAEIHLHRQPSISPEAKYIASVKLKDLCIDSLSHVVVVENGEMLVHWEMVADALPEEWQDSLIIYRGHGENQKDLIELINLLSESKVKLALFFDYDAAGLDMANDLMPQDGYLVVPDTDLEQLKSISKQEAFADQHPQLNMLLANKQIDSKIFEHARKLSQATLAVTQEHLITNYIKLSVANNVDTQYQRIDNG